MNRTAAGQVATSARSAPGLRHETDTLVSIEHCCTDSLDELSASAFGQRTVCIQMRALDVSIWTNGKQTVNGPLASGTWQVHAPGDSFRAIAKRGYELVRLGLPEAALGSALEGLGARRWPGSLEFIDPGIEVNPFLLTAAREVKSALTGNVEISRLYMDSLSAAVLSHLIFKHSNVVGSSPPPPRGGLAPRQLTMLTQYLDEHLADDVSLAELAALCGLSSYHVCRAFRQSTGLPPHRWQIVQRMERARDLLERTDRPVIDIAAAVGYADPSQFAAMFRRRIGTSPVHYLRKRRA